MDCPIYKLFEQNRCYGDQTKHENEFYAFITESYNMNDLLVHLRNFGDKNKGYIVVKYIGNIMQTRQLCIFNGSTYEKRNKTNTWNRYFYCNKKMIGKKLIIDIITRKMILKGNIEPNNELII